MNKIAIGIPTRDEVKTKFTSDLLLAVVSHLAAHPEDVVIPIIEAGTILVAQRTELVLEARRSGATHLLFLDSDMRFPADLISRLLEHEQLVVAANCARRKIPTGPTAGNVDDNLKNTPVYTVEESAGLEQVNRVGTAVMLIDMAVFDMIPVPWFATPWVSDKHCFMGEDVYFCRELTKLGVPIMIDHDLSKQIKHIGEFEFSWEHVATTLALETAKAAAESPLVVL